MPLNLSKNEGSLVLELSGSIDINSTDSLREQITAALSNAIAVRVNANDTDYIDSSGVALLLYVKQQTEAKGAVFEFASASAAVAKVIELAMLSAVLPISHVADAHTQDQASNEFSMDDFDDSLGDLFADGSSSNDSSKESSQSDSSDDIDAQTQDQASDEFSMDDFDDSFDDLFTDESSSNDSSKESANSDSGDDIFGSLDPDFK